MKMISRSRYGERIYLLSVVGVLNVMAGQ